MVASAALAQDATWVGGNAGDPNEWVEPANWTGATVPSGTATFTNTGATTVRNDAGLVIIGAVQFTAAPNAQAYTINIENSFIINGAGVANNSTNTQTFTIDDTNQPALVFQNASTANSGTGTVVYNNGFLVPNAVPANPPSNTGSFVQFQNTSNAGNAATTFNNHGIFQFFDNSSGGSATLNNDVQLDFFNSSTASNATIVNAASDTGGFAFTATITFNNSASAGSAHITNQTNNGNVGDIEFNNTSTAGSAIITNSATINFNNASTADTATITTNAGGTTNFNDASTGGSAALIFNGNGAMVVNSTAMTVGSIASSSTTSLITLNNSMTVGNAASTTFAGVIQGGGGLDKVGTGTLTLSGINTYGGATTVDGGTLTVTGSISASSGVAINSGAALNGTGLVSAVTVNSGGILMPGMPHAVGTLTGTGTVTFNANSSYQIFINGATNSKFTTTGSASLNASATVGVLNGSTIAVGNKYTILTATGGVTGSFDPTVNFGAFTGTLSQDADDVFLTFKFASMVPLLPAGTPQNAVNVASAIDNFTSNGGTLPAGFQTLFNLPPQQLVNGLEQLAGENSTGAQISGFQLMNQFMSLLLDPFTDGRGDGIGPLPFAPIGQQNTFTPEVANAYASVLKAPPAPSYGPWRAWGAAYGGTESINGAPATVGSHDITARAGGFAAGLDYRASPDSRYGFALAGAGTGWDLAQGFGSGHSDAFQAGVYGTHQFGRAYVSGALAFTNFWASTKRVVTVAGADTLEANFNAQSFGARVEGGYRLDFQPVALTPYAALQAQSFHTPGYSEKATSGSPQFALSFASQTSSAERAELGSWASHSFRMANGDSVSLFGRAAWAHDWFTNLAFTPSFQSLPGASFVVNGVTPPADLGLVTAGAEWRMTSNWSVMARFDGEFGDGAQTYTGMARARFTW